MWDDPIEALLYYFEQMKKPVEQGKDLILGVRDILVPSWEDILEQIDPDEELDRDADPWELPEEAFEEAAELVDVHATEEAIMRYDPGEARTWMGMTPLARLKNVWVIHCTRDAAKLAREGFRVGGQLDTLALTTRRTWGDDDEGYNFGYALDIAPRDALKRYGGDCVLAFVPDAVNVLHHYDQEMQTVFWGPDVDADHIFRVREYAGVYTVNGEDFEELDEAIAYLESLL